MSTIKVVSMTGAEVGTVELNDAIFGVEPNMSVVHEVVKNHLANCRQGTQSALTRAEVSGGGKKPWRQKGTGHARQGSTRAPQWTHGGIVFAPKPRDYSYVLNKKVKRLALKSALSAKAASGDIVVVDSLNLDEVKTRAMKGFLDTSFGDKNPLTFTSNFMYEFSAEVTADQLGNTELKVADAGWNINYGSCNAGDKLVVGTPLTLCKGGDTGNIGLDLAKAGTYKFVFTAMNKEKPTLSVSYTEPVQSCKVLDTVAGNPLGFPLYVRGSLSDWNAQPTYQLNYKGMEGNLAIYQAAFNYAGSFDFKFANDDGNWSKQFFVKDAGGTLIALEPEQVYPLQHGDGGMGNNSITLEQGLWSFLVKVDPTQTSGEVGSVIIQECSAK